MSTYLPGSVIGVMGGGQLGRMLAMEARRMGYRVEVFTPEEESPAGQFADLTRIADYGSEAAVRKFAGDVDVVTFEFENIPAQTVEWCAEVRDVRPAGSILHIAQNRLREKEFLTSAGVPIAPFRAVRSAQELANAIEQIGRPAILKTAAFGYDGKGQQTINSREDFDEIWGSAPAEGMVLEGAVQFEREISVIVARSPDGTMSTFPVCENIHKHHILDITVAPARVSESVATNAAALAREIAEKLGLVGLLAVEMFVKPGGEILVNELAPRPHNSGHWTIEACATSQFEQQLRAVCGLPLGSTEILRPAAMANILGGVWQQGEPCWLEALQERGDSLASLRQIRAAPATQNGPPDRDGRHRGRCDRARHPGPRSPDRDQVKTEITTATARAVELLRAGEPVALPTETVYGLAADALKAGAVLKIFEAKERPHFDPLIVHLPDRSWLARLTSAGEVAGRLADAFWPGPLTLVLPRTGLVPDVVTAGLETVAVRMSAHPVFRAVIEEFAGPLAAPSANRFGRISPTEAAHVFSELDGRIPLIVDGGRSAHGVESTIVAPRRGGLEILRHGPITAEMLAEFGEVREAAAPGAQPEAPGMLPSHYAPRTRLILPANFREFMPPAGRVGALVFGENLASNFTAVRTLSAAGDLREAAANLFRCLRELDAAGLDLIVAESVPEIGLGRAIMDRLRRAATR